MTRWACAPDTPGVYTLTVDGRPVASLWWLYEPQAPATVMTRIVDRLNLPAGECAPSPTPVWSVTLFPCTPGTIPAAWGTFLIDGVEAMAVIWQTLPSRLDEWHQRICDALNPGRGLPAVTVPVRGAA